MLGNIKFIGELGKLDMLHESILHRCIKQLLDKKKNQSVSDITEDLECLCQIMKTVGPRLDSQRAKALMDQYFMRMHVLANNTDLPARIRFMLQDTLELRESSWVPRKVLQDSSPRTIEQIRHEATKDYGVFFPPNGPNLKHKDFFGGPFDDGIDMLGVQKRGGVITGGLSDVFMPSMGSIGTGPGVIQDSFNGYSPPLGRPRSPRASDSRNANGNGNQGYQNYSNQKGQSQRQHDGGNQGNQGYQNRQGNQQRDLPPRFMKKGPFSLGSEEISLRPAKDSMVLKPQAPSMMPSARPTIGQLPQSAMAPSSAPQMTVPTNTQNQQSSPKTQARQMPTGDRPRQDKRKVPSKEELQKMVESMLEQYLSDNNISDAINTIRAMKVPRKFMPTVVCQLLTESVEKSEEQREHVSKLIATMNTEGVITEEHFLTGFTDVLNKLSDLENTVALVKSYIATFAAQAVIDDVITLVDLADPMKNGSFYPLFLLILQRMHKLKDKEWLVSVFNNSKINMQGMLPELDQSKERMMEILEDKHLSFLFPLQRMHTDLWKQVKQDPNASTLYKWIKDNVDSKLQTDAAFVFALSTIVLKYCTEESTLAEGIDKTQLPDKQLQEKEKANLSNLKPLLQAFVHDQITLQLSVLYALQVHCYNHQYPKGMMLRFFVNFYDLEVAEEEAFLKWREDINDDYPGKGKALFQVNSWLTWLETADEEEESDDEDDD
ncbi:eukaryotic translation initiation factor 4 gamma 2-like [Glandiceps talaboti]